MKLLEHPEYNLIYERNRQANQRCVEAAAAWKASNVSIDVDKYALTWTYRSAQAFVQALGTLFQAYNRVLWEKFHYCRQCGGQCCVVDASDVRVFDLLAVALLAQSPPTLPERLGAGMHDCIYLAGNQCTWPERWRTIKCWSFYCLGSGPWDPSASLSELYDTVTIELQYTVNEFLPDPLRRYESVHGDSFAAHLEDPVDFSNTLHGALREIFVAPFDAHYPVLDVEPSQGRVTHASTQTSTISNILLVDHDLYTFMVEATEEIYENPPMVPDALDVSPDQLLTDLDTLTWMMEGQPANSTQLLNEMYSRYAAAPIPAKGEIGSLWYRMRNHILYLLNL